MCKLLQSLFNKLEENKVDYRSNEHVVFIIDDLSLRLGRMFELVEEKGDLSEQLTTVLVFIALDISSRKSEDRLTKLEKMFDKCSFIGRKVMINLNQNQHKLVAVLKFFM